MMASRHFLLLLSLSLPFQYVYAQTAEKDLESLYRANPGLVTEGKPDVITAQAKRLLNPESAKRIEDLMKADIKTVQNARSIAQTRYLAAPAANLRRVVVSGASVTGLMDALVAARSGYPVAIYDTRMAYTRNIQWSGRQAIPDALAAIDPALAEKYKQEVGRNLTEGTYRIKEGVKSPGYPPAEILPGDPRRLPDTAMDLFDRNTISNLQTKALEKTLNEYLRSLPNVEVRRGKIEVSPTPDPITGEHTVKEFIDDSPEGKKGVSYKEVTPKGGKPPIVVIAEGAGSSTRGVVGIQSIPASGQRLQIAGVVKQQVGGIIGIHYRMEEPGRMVTSSIDVAGTGERWFAADIDEAKVTPDKSFGTDPKAPEFVKERSRLIDKEFRRIAELNMELPAGALSNVPVGGAVEGLPLSTFTFEQHVSSTATSGKNLLLAGDTVGNGHWMVGGGAHTGVVMHPQRFRSYLTDLENGVDPKKAIENYNKAVLTDSTTWVRNGIQHTFDHYFEPEDIRKAFDEAAELYRAGKVSSYQRAMELKVPGGRKGKEIKPLKIGCDKIIARILGQI